MFKVQSDFSFSLSVSNNYFGGIFLFGKLISFVGILGIIATLIVAATTFSSKDLLCAPFILISVLLCIIVISLGEIIKLWENKK